VLVEDLCNGCALLKQHAGPQEVKSIEGCSGWNGKGVVSIRLPYQGYDDVYRLCGCIMNARLALQQRLVYPAELALAKVKLYKNHHHWVELYKILTKIAREVSHIRPLTPIEFLKTANSRQRPVWERAIRQDRSFRPSWMTYDGFVKIEKYSYYEKPNRIPRLILPPSDHAKVVMGMHIKPIEKHLKEVVGPGNVYPFMAKGMSSSQLAERFKGMAEQFKNPTFISIDMSKCDSTIGSRLKKLENIVFTNHYSSSDYVKCMKQGEKDFMKVRLHCNDGTTETKEIPQCRASGTAHTGAGNTVLVYGASAVVLRGLNNEIFSNGDDTILIVEASDSAEVIHRINSGEYSIFGFDVRIEQIATDIEDVFWCQCYYTVREQGPIWIRDYRKVLQTILSNENYGSPNWLSYLSTICLGEGSTNPGQPIIAPLVSTILKLRHKRMRLPNENQTTRRWELEGCPSVEELDLEVTARDRDCFHARYGISPVEQLRMEAVNNLALRGLGNEPVRHEYWQNRIHPVG